MRFLLLALLTFTSYYAALVAAGPMLMEPTLLSSPDSEWSATLTVQAARYDNGVFAFTGRQYCVSGVCTFPGPTLQLKPNDTFHLTVVNLLGPDPVDSMGMPGMSMATGMGMAAAAIPNTTNIHTHGLHISPLVDSVFLSIAPGQTRTYVYRVPANHAPGLHWYHAHQHTTATLQVMGGLHGAILVPDPRNSANLPASYAAMTKHLLVLSHLQFAQLRINGSISQGCAEGAGCSVAQGCASDATNSPFSLFRSYSYLELSNEAGSTLRTDPTFMGGAPVNQYVVNGQFQPSISMMAGEYRVLRVVHTGGAHTVEWQTPRGCSMTLLAIDGVFLTSTQDKTLVRMTQAGRWEIMTMCTMAGSYAISITFGEVPRLQQTLLTLEVTAMAGGGAMMMNSPVTSTELALIRRPDYLSDLRSSSAPFTFAVHFGHLPGRSPSSCGQWLGSGSECSSVWKMKTVASESRVGNTCPFELFPGQQGGNGSDPWQPTRTYKHVTPVGAINEWKIYGMGMDMSSMGASSNMHMRRLLSDTGMTMGTGMDMGGTGASMGTGTGGMGMMMGEVDTHPFHMHAHHVQVIGFTPSSPAAANTVDWREYFTVGEWRDTLPSLDGELVVRFAASHFAGETVIHCHVLRHEDIGMMSSFYVCDPLSPGACPPAVLAVLRSSAHSQAQAAWPLLLLLTTSVAATLLRAHAL